MKIISIALKDLQILLQDRGALFQLFILPLVFIFVISGALGGTGNNDEGAALPQLAVVDQDGAQAGKLLVEKLTEDGSLEVTMASADEAQALLSAQKVVGSLTIPPGFTSGVEQSQAVTLVLTTASKANPQVVNAIRMVIESITADLSLESQIIASLQQLGEMRGSLPAESEVFATERVVAQARQQFVDAQVRPLISIVQAIPNQDAREETPDFSQSAVPGFTVLFVFLAAQSTARSIYEEKKIGSFRRLVAAPLSKAELLIGKLLPNFITNLAQIAVIFVLGSLGMRLLGLTPLPFAKALVGTVLVSVVLALSSSALGIAIAGLAHTENQISGFSTLLLWGMGLVGGSLVPLFLLERFLGKIPMIVPHYWANRAFDDLLVRRLGMADVGLDLLVLLGFCLVFFAIGLWRFDYER